MASSPINESKVTSRTPRAVVMTPAKWKSRKRTFENEWTFQAFEEHTSFFTKRMFGGLAVYLFGRMMMV
jgi:hypothetical protein